MSTDKGYIKVYRDIRDHWIWEDSENLKAWLDLVMMAQHEPKQLTFNNELLDVDRGSFITSVRKLADRWKWGKDRVLKFLRVLQKAKMIDRVADRKKTLITIINYDFYQKKEGSKKTQSRTQSGTGSGTGSRTQSRTQSSHNEGIKEDITEDIKKKEAPPPEDDEDEGEPWPDDFWEI